ncbi:tail fiber assembly protein [Enterobacter ludwigii]|uniref:tail fiber assembly protein n=1 Tax=Enterobacter ludwigii TaxID=299767 RepID=UPI00307603E4
MENYKNFSTYHPESAPVEVLVLPDGRPAVMTWLRDEEGNDWYDVQQNFADDTLKVLYDGKGIICCFSNDVTELNPVNMSVAEVGAEDLPEGALDSLTDGTWCYLDGRIQKYQPTPDELQEIAQQLKRKLLAEADGVIALLERAVKHGIATEEEKLRLEAWEKYSVLLSRVSPEKPEWPDMPE